MIGSPSKPARRNVFNLHEMLDTVNSWNGTKRVFVSVFDSYRIQQPDGSWNMVTKQADVDKLFFDFDSPKRFENIKKIHKWLIDKSIKHIMFFSGNGFHMYILCKDFENLKNNRDSIYNAQHYIAKEINLTIGDPKICDIDRVLVGNISAMAGFPGTWNSKRRRYCICVTEEDLEKGYEYIREKAKKPNLICKYYGKNLFSIKKFDTERPQSYPILELSGKVKLKINKDEFLKTLPPCVSHWLTMKHMGYQRRGYAICYLRDSGNLLNETIQILEKYMSNSEFIHCTTKKIAPGYKEQGEEQPQYLYKSYVRQKFTFPSCNTIKTMGDCPFEGNKKCDKWRLYL